MLLELQDSQLVLVDYQSQLMPVMHEGDAVLRNGVRLAQMAHLLKVPTWGTEQNPERLGHNPVEISEVCRRTLAKMSFGACEEGLGEVLRPQASAPSGNARSLPRHLQKAVPAPVRNSVVIAGCEAHICLLQTALGLLEEEFEVWVVTDACASRSERNRDAAFDRLAGAGAELLTTEMVAFEWLRTAEHPQFKAVQALIK
ncbi:MAG: isochorismatase family protein [Betaproteobacteria bacterium]|jgi:nicotinamidase-related amidase|nr:isochorismatase family protein [Betaproteobacteria bacterium]NBO89730.1 isochorismatase family protein [Betaproteobacteria bacterium]NBU43540.1 isochorismatase family protein [Betaproteobacteria bacterium]NDF66018.1 isochorismatase family protein [Betaproteobacteria bacterium]